MKEYRDQDRRGSTTSNKPDISAPGISTPDSQMRKENWNASAPKNSGRDDGGLNRQSDRPNVGRSPHG